ncbi:chemotaxis protein CheC [Halorussus gelatinilyticus]|uniref:Chemotaxis protein CheC n=1 Tax=Halorussus gelatinilyticus TaxID=2937524 RepID=A0A8U0IIB0_9EURY|nr:chemotaxis protein CheC [Halorussus gelatinilyticus]UPW00435.1 chemotaxis protein CheC [Halorussus gelatinilyticus]
MNVDVESLGTFNRTAQVGARRAAENLTGMTGIETAVDVTEVTLASADDLARGDRRVGVAIDFEGGIDGTSLLTFSPEGVEVLLDTLLPGEGVEESAVAEIGNIVTSGFVEGWADHLDAIIDISPPAYVEGTGEEVLDAAGFERDRAFVFRSQVGAVGKELDVEFHMFPERDSMEEMLSGGDDPVSVEKLATLREMAEAGAATASETVSAMTGIGTDVDITHLSFVPIEDVPAELADRPYVGVVLRTEGALGGYVLVLFDEASAREVAAALVPGTDEVTTFNEQAQSAMKEIGNVMTSSFIDGWANVLDATIDISPPQFVHDAGPAVAESVVARLGRTQSFAFLFDATLRADDREFDCGIYALPDETDLRTALEDIDPDATAERKTKAGTL